MSNQKDPFVSINSNELEVVAGGAGHGASSGSSSGTNDQLMQMLTTIGNSIKDLAKNNNGGPDQMTTMMMMMMMMGGSGGGGGGGIMGASPQPTYVEVCGKGGCGKKGW